MIKKTLFILLLAFGTTFCKAQTDLLLNGTFESYSACPGIPTSVFSPEIERCIGWSAPTSGTSDYFNSCNSAIVSVPSNFCGNQAAYDGNGYCGFYAYWDRGAGGYISTSCYIGRYWFEYVQGQLLSPLESGHVYQIQFHFSLADASTISVGELGIYLSEDPVGYSCGAANLPFLPQIKNSASTQLDDTLNWVTVSGEYVANGGEKYITIGNFKDSLTTDTTTIKTGPGRIAYYYVDGGEVKDRQLPNVFTPNNDGVNDLFSIPGMAKGGNYCIYDRWGLSIFKGEASSAWDGTTEKGIPCTDGVYYYISYSQGLEKKGCIQLLR